MEFLGGTTPTTRADVGPHTITVRVDDGHGGAVDDTFQLTVQGQVITLDPSAKQTKAVFTDTSGDTVTVKMAGKVGKVYLIRPVAPDSGGTYSNATPGDMYSIEAESTDQKTKLTIAVKGPAKGARTSVTDIHVTGSLGTLSGATTDLLGDAAVSGTLAGLKMGGATAGGTITIGPRSAGDTKTTTALTFDRVAEMSVNSATPVKSLTVTEWLDADGTNDLIQAPSIAKLTVKGDKRRSLAGNFQAGLELSGVAWLPASRPWAASR